MQDGLPVLVDLIILRLKYDKKFLESGSPEAYINCKAINLKK